jgi:hypothetical protein
VLDAAAAAKPLAAAFQADSVGVVGGLDDVHRTRLVGDVVGLPSSSVQQANGWCQAAGLDADHRFAKMISSARGVNGTTVYRK